MFLSATIGAASAAAPCRSWSRVSNNIEDAEGWFCYFRDFNSNIPGNIVTYKCDTYTGSVFSFTDCPFRTRGLQTEDVDMQISNHMKARAGVANQLHELLQEIRDCEAWSSY